MGSHSRSSYGPGSRGSQLSSHITQTGKGTKGLLKALQNVSVTVGIHEAEGRQSKEGSDKDESLAEVATKHEFGLGTPRRSTIADWFDSREPELREDLQRIAKAAVASHMPVAQAAQRFGALCVGQIQQRIADGIPPELSARRKAEKEALSGSPKDTPLIFTGQFRSSFRSVVEVVP